MSVGYYIGGMKEAERKESETKQLILGTYSMAKEGLDIKSLNTLIMASPKSDIIQTIGRIMRQKHENLNPKIIDIVDNFSVFKNQGKRRFGVYKKRKYKVTDIELDIDKLEVLGKKTYNFHEKVDTKKKKTLKKSKKDNVIANLKFSKWFK
jgi:superfamily II DNA or RNA helicase